MNNLLNLGISEKPKDDEKRKLKVVDIAEKEVQLKNQDIAKKVIFKTVETATGKNFTISDAWIESPSDKRVAGIWLSLEEEQEISKGSTLAKLLKRQEVDTLGELIGKELDAYPDKNNFLVFTTCNL